MSNHYLNSKAREIDPSDVQPGLASFPHYKLNEMPSDEVLRYSLAGVNRKERERLSAILAEANSQFVPRSLAARIAIGIGKLCLAALCIFSVWAFVLVLSMEVR